MTLFLPVFLHHRGSQHLHTKARDNASLSELRSGKGMQSRGNSMCEGVEASEEGSRRAVLTGSLAGVGEDNDVVKGPGVVGVRGVEGQLGCPLRPQGYQEGGVDHGDPEAAPALAVLCGEVLSCAAVVALGRGALGSERDAPSQDHCSRPGAQTPRPSGPLL